MSKIIHISLWTTIPVTSLMSFACLDPYSTSTQWTPRTMLMSPPPSETTLLLLSILIIFLLSYASPPHPLSQMETSPPSTRMPTPLLPIYPLSNRNSARSIIMEKGREVYRKMYFLTLQDEAYWQPNRNHTFSNCPLSIQYFQVWYLDGGFYFHAYNGWLPVDFWWWMKSFIHWAVCART